MLHYICFMAIIRKTKPLKIVLAAFDNSNHALSVVELVKRFQNDMNKTTVYRVLDRLLEENILHSFTGKDGFKWVAKCEGPDASTAKNHHPHFQCKECGKSECLSIDISIPTVPNRRIDSSNLILIGRCEECIV